MRYFYLASIAGLLALTACNSTTQPCDANFAKALNQYLADHGEACTVIGHQFPVDVSRSEQREQYGIGPKLAALEQADLVQVIETTAVIHGMLDPLRGSTPPQSVKRYELTEDGKRYFQLIPGTPGRSSGFCYGQKRVDAIVKWTEPIEGGASSRAEITYTYKIDDVATWAQRPDVQRAFSDIRTTVNGASKTTEIAGLQLTSNGWEVPGQ